MFIMTPSLENKLKEMFWDMPSDVREKMVKKIINEPMQVFKDEQVLLKALNTLGWYELIELSGNRNLLEFLPDQVITRLFPQGRRRYYSNAKRLLSKYTIPVSK